jgi:hypothetical protein
MIMPFAYEFSYSFYAFSFPWFSYDHDYNVLASFHISAFHIPCLFPFPFLSYTLLHRCWLDSIFFPFPLFMIVMTTMTTCFVCIGLSLALGFEFSSSHILFFWCMLYNKRSRIFSLGFSFLLAFLVSGSVMLIVSIGMVHPDFPCCYCFFFTLLSLHPA